MTVDHDMRRKRGLVGLLSVGGLMAGVALLVFGDHEGTASALIRVGILLGALWLALPAGDRPAAWARISPWTIAVLAVVAALIPRLRPIAPALIIGVAIGWIVRPRKRRQERTLNEEAGPR